MINRKWLPTSVVVLFICCLMIGCERDATPEKQAESVASKVKIPLLSQLTLEELKTRLGSDFTVEKAGPPTVLLRESGALRTVVIVMHDEAGKIQTVSAHVLSDQGSDDQIDPLLTDIGKTVAQALDISVDDDFENLMKIGVLRTRLGFAFNFTRGSAYFDLIPDNGSADSWKWVSVKPGQVKRDIYLSPSRSSKPKPFNPIQGATVEQLTELLDGFNLEVEIQGEPQQVFVRKLDDHLEVVHCRLNAEGLLTRIEAFVGAVAEGADTKALNQQLWLKLSQLEYRESDPAKVVAFLEGPMPTYSIETGVNVGYATYCLPFFTRGGRILLAIYAHEPAKKDAAK